MIKLDTFFEAADGLTPEFAAKLSAYAARFESDISVECGEKCLNLDSLICILSLELYRGVKVSILADGSDEAAAAEEIRKVLQGEI